MTYGGQGEIIKWDGQRQACCANNRLLDFDKESYMTVTVHYVSEKQKMISRVLNTIQLEERHTSENFAAQLMKIASDWNLTGKIAGVVTDNAYNIKHANI